MTQVTIERPTHPVPQVEGAFGARQYSPRHQQRSFCGDHGRPDPVNLAASDRPDNDADIGPDNFRPDVGHKIFVEAASVRNCLRLVEIDSHSQLLTVMRERVAACARRVMRCNYKMNLPRHFFLTSRFYSKVPKYELCTVFQ